MQRGAEQSLGKSSTAAQDRMVSAEETLSNVVRQLTGPYPLPHPPTHTNSGKETYLNIEGAPYSDFFGSMGSCHLHACLLCMAYLNALVGAVLLASKTCLELSQI